MLFPYFAKKIYSLLHKNSENATELLEDCRKDKALEKRQRQTCNSKRIVPETMYQKIIMKNNEQANYSRRA